MANAYFSNTFSFSMVNIVKEGRLIYCPFKKKMIEEFFLNEGTVNEYTIVPSVNDLAVARAVADDLGIPIAKIYGGPAAHQFMIINKDDLIILINHKGMHLPAEIEKLPEGGEFEYLGIKFR